MRRFADADVPARYGRYAVVAGASEGIGAAFARRLAASGLDLMLVARRREPLDAIAREVRKTSGRDVRTVAADLGEPAGLDALLAAAHDLEVGLLVYNAAFSPIGRFLARPIDEHLRAIAVNVRAPVALAHTLGGRMAARGRGGIVLMTSLAGMQGTPLVASYAASKAFALVLAEGLWDELRDGGVDVLACCAGATLTPGYERSAPKRPGAAFAPAAQDADDVAREALEALGDRPFVVTGRANRFASALMSRVLTRRRAVLTMGKEMRSRYE